MVGLDVACPYFSRYGPVPFGIPFAAWVVLLVLVAWHDDAAMRGWMLWWFVAILDLYLGVYAGWHALNPPVTFRSDGFISGLVVGVLPVLVLYVLARWAILGLLSKCRRFLRPDECQRCGYPLHGLETRCCPECGTSFDPSRIKEQASPAASGTITS